MTMHNDAQQPGQACSSAETREVDTFHSDKCPTCLGDGYIGQHANSPDVKCPNCSGTGFVDTGPNVELLIENLVQAAAEYENNCDRLVAKKIRVELERAKQAIRDAITTQPQASTEPSSVTEGMRGAADITAERQRQVAAEGWSPDHDDEHADHQIPLAALCYLYASIYDPGSFVFRYWPWDQAWWKPADARRNLVKAGALIAAEIDRLDRASQHPSTERP